MKTKWLATMALFSCLMMFSQIALAQDLASQLVSEWRQTSVARKYVMSGVLKPGEPSGVAIFTRGGFFAFTLKSTEFFGSGTFKVEGDVVVLRYEVCSEPSWIGQERRPTMRVAGKILTWTGAPLKDAAGDTYNEIYTLENIK
jgi:hypothetical protein